MVQLLYHVICIDYCNKITQFFFLYVKNVYLGVLKAAESTFTLASTVA